MKIYNVMQYGAKGDGKTNDAFSIQHAIDDCAKSGGGRVVLPSGYVFYSDSIRLKKNVDLHIQKGATIKATSNIDGYIRTITDIAGENFFIGLNLKVSMRYSYISKVERLFPKTKKSEPLKFFNRKVISTEKQTVTHTKKPENFSVFGLCFNAF